MSNSPSALSEFRVLLGLQDIDTHIDQLVYKRSHLPGLQVIETIKARAGDLRSRMAEVGGARDALAERQASLEAEIETITARVAQIDARLYGSVAVSPKDAQAMAEEAKHLRERKATQEDLELEVMEELEPVQAAFDLLAKEGSALSQEMQTVSADVEAEQSVLDEQLTVERQKRATAAGSIAPVLLTEYERLRKSLGGIAAAPLVGSSCGGCHISMSGAELEQIKKAPAEAIVHCDECGRILVRA